MTLDFIAHPSAVVLAVAAICLIYFGQRTPRRLPDDPAWELLFDAGVVRRKSGGVTVYPRMVLGDGYLLPESEIDPYLEWVCKKARWVLKVSGWVLLTLSIIMAVVDLRGIDFFLLMMVLVTVLGQLFTVVHRRFVNRDFGARFLNAKKTGDPNRWQRWVLATLTRKGHFLWLSIAYAVFLFAFPIFFALPILAFDLNHLRIPPLVSWFDWGKHLLVVVLVIVTFWSAASFYGFLVVKEVMFRRRHGRPPDQKDVEALG